MSSQSISPTPQSAYEADAELVTLGETLPENLRRSTSSLFDTLRLPPPPSPRPGARRSHLAHLRAALGEQPRAESPMPMPTPPKHDVLYPALNTKQLSTGVLWVTERANEYGFDEEPEAWSNLGQGSPEHGDTVPGLFIRPKSIAVSNVSKGYGPTAGVRELREAVANLYNAEYRKGKASQYTWKNVCVVPGGRAGLSRIAAILADCYLLFFLPDYTAYAEMLSLFKNLAPIPVPLAEEDNYHVRLELVKNELDRGVLALLTSNPRNPTGMHMARNELQQLHDMCRAKCLLIMDEFYTHYHYDKCDGKSILSAEFVEDVNADPVLLINGMTKAFRLPGWRTCWIVGPEAYISALLSAGSFLDGGSNAPFQYAAAKMLAPELVRAEMAALQRHFKSKRDYCIARLESMGFDFKGRVPTLTFYIWLDLGWLPGKLGNSLGFFHECLHEKVITVPGFFFLINPQNLSRLHDVVMYGYVRLSYGPEMEELVRGMDGIERVLRKFGITGPRSETGE